MDVCGTPGIDVVAERICALLYRAEGVGAALISDHAAAAAEIRIDRREVRVILAPVPGRRRWPAIPPPMCSAHRGRFREHTAMHDGPFSYRLTCLRVIQDRVAIAAFPAHSACTMGRMTSESEFRSDHNGSRGERRTLVLSSGVGAGGRCVRPSAGPFWRLNTAAVSGDIGQAPADAATHADALADVPDANPARILS